MKKRLFLMLAIVLMVALVLPLGVSANEEVEKYVPKIKKIFDIGDEYGEFNVYTHDYRGRITYGMSWMNSDNRISVDIDPDGNIRSYSKYSNRYEEEHARFPKISEEEALKEAKEIIAKIDSNLLENTEYEDIISLGNLNSYHFRFVRNENDIPFNYNSIYIDVNNSTGEINNVNIDWDRDIKLPNKDNIINEEEAYDLYKENQGVELVYRLNNKDNNLEGNLLYEIKDKNRAIDAKTGKEIEDLNSSNNYIHYGLFFGNMEKVSIEDEKELINAKEIISKNEAEKELRKFANLDKSYTMQGSDLMKSKVDESYLWQIQIHKQEGNSGYGTTVSVNAKTKEVLSFHNFNMREDEEPKYNEDEALKKAQEFLQEKMSDKYRQVEYTGSMFYRYEENIQEYSFIFNRVIDGVKIPQNGFSLSISAITGEVMSYNYMWNDIEIPSKEGIVEEEKAEETLLSNGKLELNYIMGKDSIKNKKKEIKLVYNLSSEENVFVDAYTGEVISSQDLFGIDLMNEMEKEYEDIDKSYAKDEIKRLKENGIYLPGENFSPKEDIIQKDFLYLLSNTKGYISSYNDEYIYERFSREGVVKTEEKDPDKTITRGEAIKYIVRSFGQEKSANLGDIYKSNYKDIDSVSKELKGYIAVAEGLGVISGEGNFRANDNLTRQEAAMLIFNILNR